jgi:hypothetical protein
LNSANEKIFSMQKPHGSAFIENTGREYFTSRQLTDSPQGQNELLYLFHKYNSLCIDFKIASN